jgi:hypothetical protein
MTPVPQPGQIHAKQYYRPRPSGEREMEGRTGYRAVSRNLGGCLFQALVQLTFKLIVLPERPHRRRIDDAA